MSDVIPIILAAALVYMLALNMNGSGDPNTSTESMRSPVSGPGQWYVPPDPNHGAFIPLSQV
jgi:hypothetical protein